MNTNYKQYFPSLTILFILLAALTFARPASAQNVGSINFKQLQASDLSNRQIKRLWKRAQKNGYSLLQLKQMAVARGMDPAEASKLVQRVRNLGTQAQYNPSLQQPGILRSVFRDSLLSKRQHGQSRFQRQSRIFGASLFNNQNISFTPALNIPTPESYQLGTGDEIIVDIWGATDKTIHLQISQDGTVMLPRVGPVYLNGLSIKEARGLLKNDLEDIYASLKNDKSKLRLTLGDIRSIQVTVLGDVTVPGTFTVPSLTTAFNALYIAGGPDSTGTYRKIKIIRNGSVVDSLDVYNFLVSGQMPKSIHLRDQDIIKIGPYLTRIDLTGRTKRNGIFELKPGETISDLIRFAGGFATGAYTKTITVVRETPTESKYMNIQYPQQKNFVLQNGDSVHVGKILKRVTNQVKIHGAVYRQGPYALRDTTTLYSLIKRAGGVRDSAFLNRGLIYRERSNLTTKVMSFNPRKVIADPAEYDIPLQENDSVVVKSIFDMRNKYTIQVYGAVQDTGSYPFVYDMTLAEAILQADGFDPSADPYRVEVARRVTKIDSIDYVPKNIVKTYSFSVNKNLKLTARGNNFELYPYDQLFVRSSPAYYKQQNVRVKGQVLYPGKYALKAQNSRISDLIKQAGGLTRFAYQRGATLIRHVKLTNQVDTSAVNIADSLNANSNIGQTTYQVGINLAKIMKHPDSKYDLFLHKGDLLKIPKKLQTVRITGDVLHPVIVRYAKGRSFKDYIRAAGGVSNRGQRKDAYIVYANGSVDRASHFLFFRNYPKVKPGATIYVPPKPQNKGLSTAALISVLSTVVTTLAIVARVILK